MEHNKEELRNDLNKKMTHEESSKPMTAFEFGKIRKKTGLSQVEFGELFGYKRPAINLFENEKRAIPQALAMAIRYYIDNSRQH